MQRTQTKRDMGRFGSADDVMNYWLAQLTANRGLGKLLSGTVKIVVEDIPNGSWVVKFDSPPAVVRGGERAQCRITLSYSDLLALANGELNPQSAWIQGRVRISGDTTLAHRLHRLFALGRTADDTTA